MTTQTIEKQLAKAEEKAAELRAKVDQAKAEQAAARAAEKERADRARDAFEAQRRAEFKDHYMTRVREAVDNFTATVIDGGDALAAYMAYRRAHAEANAEAGRIVRWIHQRALATWERRLADLQRFDQRRDQLATRVSRAEAMLDARPKHARGGALPEDLTREVEQWHTDLNKWAADEGLEYRRNQAASLDAPLHAVQIIGGRPSELGILPSQAPVRTFDALLADAISAAETEFGKRHRAQADCDLAAFTAKFKD